MKGFPFMKMSGSGNDFILGDNRQGTFAYEDMPALARRLCARKVSVGADGLILLENSDEADFAWRFFNADGSEAEMCGNGARCAARFAYLSGIAGKDMRFVTLAGVIHAQVADGTVRVRMTPPMDLVPEVCLDVDGEPVRLFSVNTGVPHAVVRVDDLEAVDVDGLGRRIRFHEHFAPAGANVNFLWADGAETRIRTYERGVEGETLACGTGAVASALCRAMADDLPSPVKVLTRGGVTLLVHFCRQGESFDEVYLEGDARIIYRGTLGEDI
ncbi:MAG: diaminopimelate epimerase [Deltaproteobacteria bacterium]|nr:diaminopimelate epimerase [Deltaproteobacteria bacterium]